MPTPILLHIETSTTICSVALSHGNELLFYKMNDEGMNHAALLSVFIQEALAELKKENKSLNAVAVSSGPGSYTGLRIGLSTAKGICFGLNIPLISVSTLEILTVPAIKRTEIKKNTLFCPMIDARRMEVYSAFYKQDLTVFRGISADIITEDSYHDILENNQVYFFGNGAEKCKELLTHSNAHFTDNLYPTAENMIDLALKKYNNAEFEDSAYFEPFYLKEFQATIPKKMI